MCFVLHSLGLPYRPCGWLPSFFDLCFHGIRFVFNVSKKRVFLLEPVSNVLV